MDQMVRISVGHPRKISNSPKTISTIEAYFDSWSFSFNRKKEAISVNIAWDARTAEVSAPPTRPEEYVAMKEPMKTRKTLRTTKPLSFIFGRKRSFFVNMSLSRMMSTLQNFTTIINHCGGICGSFTAFPFPTKMHGPMKCIRRMKKIGVLRSVWAF